MVKDFFGFIIEHGELVKGMLVGVAAGFTALKVIETVKVMVAGFQTAVAGLALLTNPVGLVVAAIGLLAFAAYEVYQHWDGISTFFVDLWDKVKATVSTAANSVVEFFRRWG